MDNLPPGVSDSDIPGNRPEDEAWEKVHELLDSEASVYGWGPEEAREMLWWGVLVYRNIRERSKERLPVGTPGVRDPDLPCDAFRPGKPGGDCETDGHYLCEECAERRLFVCEVCGTEYSSRAEMEDCIWRAVPLESHIDDDLEG
jgi:hypothetical protein